MDEITESSGNVFKDIGCENPEGLKTVAELAANQIAALSMRIAFLEKEIQRHLIHKRDAREAVREAMSLCQHTPEEWMAMSPELRDFKLKIFGVLEMRCVNLGYGTRT
jgi:uncharacterized small protein (DUF1192 family)